jgi:AcrR family transcriptional regulator
MDTRSAILDNALALFAEKGYDGAGIQEIVDKSGITKPTLYHYFGSKFGLLETMLKEKTSAFMEALREAADYKGDLVLTLTKTVRAYFLFAGDNPDFYRFLVSLNFTGPGSDAYKAAMEIWKEQHRIIKDMFLRSVRENGNLRDRNDTLAFTFVGMVNNYLTLHFHNRLELKEELIHRAVKQYMHGIYA